MSLDRTYSQIMEFKFPPRQGQGQSTSGGSFDTVNDALMTPASTMRLAFSPRSSSLNRIGLSRQPSDSLSSALYSTISITDPTLIHPIFINSDLSPDARFYNFKELYPVDRLNPVAMGYFNYPEYEAAMSSINAAEAMLRDPEGYNMSRRLSARRTLRQRRSNSTLPFHERD